jgi:M61 glycyl aminopeptidase
LTKIRPDFVALFSLLLFLSPLFIRAEERRVSIVVKATEARAAVRIDFDRDLNAITFIQAYAGISNLQDRVHGLSAKDSGDRNVELTDNDKGEHRGTRPFCRIAYEIDLTPPSAPENGSHISWLSGPRGVLMLGDLLPEEVLNPEKGNGIVVGLDLPSNWRAFNASSMGNLNGEIRLQEPSTAVIALGSDLRSTTTRAGDQQLKLVTTGDWAFATDEALQIFSNVVREGQKVYGASSSESAALFLFPFPKEMAPNRWSAETRGETVFLLSGRQSSKTAAATQLNVALAHETLHLWVPNALALGGNYDWFYEGFTTYQSLRIGVATGFLSFNDFLSAIAKSFDSYRTAENRDLSSLLELSRQRWSGSEALIYNKGALVAFLYDMAVRESSDSKQSIELVYASLMRLHRKPSLQADGDSTVLGLMRASPAGDVITRRFVEGREAINLQELIKPYGLVLETNPVRSQIKVSPSLNGRQKSLLKRLGYSGA